MNLSETELRILEYVHDQHCVQMYEILNHFATDIDFNSTRKCILFLIENHYLKSDASNRERNIRISPIGTHAIFLAKDLKNQKTYDHSIQEKRELHDVQQSKKNIKHNYLVALIGVLSSFALQFGEKIISFVKNCLMK